MKLKTQQEASKNAILTGVRLYIDGYLEDTTDIEMKRIVVLAGGQIMLFKIPLRHFPLVHSICHRNAAAGATHIVTSQQLNGSKTHKVLMSKPRNKVYVVRPEWITDSIRVGRRQLERDYLVIKGPGAGMLEKFVGKGT